MTQCFARLIATIGLHRLLWISFYELYILIKTGLIFLSCLSFWKTIWQLFVRLWEDVNSGIKLRVKRLVQLFSGQLKKLPFARILVHSN